MLEATIGGKPEEWTFNVLFEFPDATDEQLAEYEHKAIYRAYDSRPDAVLNAIVPQGRGDRRTNSPKTMITGANGSIIPQSEAARMLGVSHKTLQKRLQKRRKTGETKVAFAELQALSAAFRH